jgi:hypothetical protein
MRSTKKRVTARDAAGGGLLLLGLLLGIVALFFLPVSFRAFCLAVNYGDFVKDEIEVTRYDPGDPGDSRSGTKRHKHRQTGTSPFVECFVVSSGEEFQLPDSLAGEDIAELDEAGKAKGHRATVWYLPTQGVWSTIDNAVRFRVLSPDEFETPTSYRVIIIVVNLLMVWGAVKLFRRGLRPAKAAGATETAASQNTAPIS